MNSDVHFHPMCDLLPTIFAQATTTPAHQMDMQCEYMKLRSEMLKAYVFLIQACNTLRSCPPPAIAASMAMTSRDDLQKSGRVIMQVS